VKKACFLLLLLPLIFVVSCRNDDKAESYPTIADVWLNPTQDYYLLVEHARDYYNKYDAIYLEVISKEPCTGMEINNQVLYLDSSDYNPSLGYYTQDFVTDNLTPEILNSSDGKLHYSLSFAESAISGTLTVPAEYLFVIDDFDPEQDFVFEWQLAQNPDFQSFRFEVRDLAGNGIYDVNNISGKVRSLTWNKALWENYGIIEYFELELAANNYKYSDGGLVWIIRSREYNLNILDKSPHREPFSRLNKLIKGEIKLPR